MAVAARNNAAACATTRDSITRSTLARRTHMSVHVLQAAPSSLGLDAYEPRHLAEPEDMFVLIEWSTSTL